MAKSSKPRKYNKTILEEQVKPKATEETAKIMLLFAVDKYVYTNQSGNRIVWPGAGSVNTVSREDANWLLSRIRVSSCCGGSPTSKPMFVEV